MDLGAERADDVLEGDLPAHPAGHHRGRAARVQPVDRRLRGHQLRVRHRPTRSRSGCTRSSATRCRSRSTSSARSCSSARSGSCSSRRCARVASRGCASHHRRAAAGGRRRSAMVDTVPAPGRRVRSPARPLGRAARVGPDHEPRRGPRRGLVARDARGRAVPRLHLGDRRHQHGPRPPARRRGDPGAGGEAAPRPAEHRLPRARAAAVRAPRGPAAERAVVGVPRQRGAEAVEAAVKLARVATGRPAIIAFRYGFHGRTAQAMALTAAKDVYRGAFEPLPGSVYHASYPYCYRAAGGPHDPSDVHVRLGGAARPAVPPARVPGQGRGDHRGAGHRRGRLPRAAADVPAAAPGDHPRARDPAHRRRGPDGLRADRRAVRGAPLGRRSRHRRHGQGDRLGACRCPGSCAKTDAHGRACRPGRTAARTAATSSRARRRSRRSTSSRTRGWSPTRASAARSCWTACGRLAASHPSIGDVRGLGLMVALELVKPGEGDGRTPDPGRHEARPAACFDRRPAGPHRRHLRQRDPDHPAARDDGRGGRPRAGGDRRGARRRRRLRRTPTSARTAVAPRGRGWRRSSDARGRPRRATCRGSCRPCGRSSPRRPSTGCRPSPAGRHGPSRWPACDSSGIGYLRSSGRPNWDVLRLSRFFSLRVAMAEPPGGWAVDASTVASTLPRARPTRGPIA